MGAENVIVSLGGKGAYLNAKGVDPLLLEAPKGHVVNTVGAGDSLVAGFLDEYLRSNNVVRAFKWGIATGSASAFSEGLAEKKDVETLFETIK
jgi:1-phosphofructokinase